MITQAELKELLDYDALTGVFRWKIRPAKNVKIGDVAGSLNHDGYRQIKISGKMYTAHRLAWLYVHGIFPINELNHMNFNRDDNCISNLEECTRLQQMQHKRKAKSNKSGYLGVCFHKSSQKYIAQIGIDGRKIFLGSFNTPEEAYEAYKAAKAELHPFSPVPHQ